MSEHAKPEAATAQYAPTEIGADLSKLPANEQQALAKLVQAGWIMDALFLRQAWAGNEGLLLNLLTDRSPLGQARTRDFLLNKGPWDRLEHNTPFLAAVPPKPEGANFYPAGATKTDLEAWLTSLSEADRTRANGFFTTIRRSTSVKGKTGFEVVPYSVEYQVELARAAELFSKAAKLTAQPPRVGESRDNDGEALEKRKDDAIEVVEFRQHIFDEHAQPILAYFRQEAPERFCIVNGEQPINDVYADTLSVLGLKKDD